jgi:A/G-specific adenine glycosylase
MQTVADAVVPRDRPDAWTHAVMDLGQRLCRPAKPRCAECPAISWCRYAAGDRPAVAGAKGPRAVRRPEPAFPSTNRWLRGRILDRARAADGGEWIAFADPIGTHAPRAVRAAVLALAAEGLLESRETTAGPEARLPG